MPTIARPGFDTSAPPQPVRFAGEPPAAYGARMTKWAQDNARWAGQKRALERLDQKPTAIPQQEY